MKSSGFTLFESLVALFVFLVGVLGVVSVFSAGLHTRMLSQEMITAQELAHMWADWVRFRLADDPANTASGDNKDGGYKARISFADLNGASGNFGTGANSLGAGVNSLDNLPTRLGSAGQGAYNAFDNYMWQVSAVENFTPNWQREDAISGDITTGPWTKRLDGEQILPDTLMPDADGLRLVRLQISRGGRKYEFDFVFTGAGLRYK